MESGREAANESVSASTSPDVPSHARPSGAVEEPSRLQDDRLQTAIREACEAQDPVPDGMVERCLAVARAEWALPDDLDYELLVLLERAGELAGTRSAASSYTLRFGNESMELLLRASPADDEGRARLDGWVVPPGPGSIEARALGGDEAHYGAHYEATVDDAGRFEFADLPSGLYRLWLQGADSATLGTPAFEI